MSKGQPSRPRMRSTAGNRPRRGQTSEARRDAPARPSVTERRRGNRAAGGAKTGQNKSVVPDRQGNSSARRTATNPRTASAPRVTRQTDEPVPFKPKGSLRKKLTMTMLLVVGVALIALGLIMATITNKALFNQTKHSGIQIAKIYAALGQAVEEYAIRAGAGATGTPEGEVQPADVPTNAEVAESLRRYLNDTLTWGDETQWTFVDAVTFDTKGLTPISAVGVGEEMTQTSSRLQGPQVISVPGVGDLNLSAKEDIEYYILQRQVNRALCQYIPFALP